MESQERELLNKMMDICNNLLSNKQLDELYEKDEIFALLLEDDIKYMSSLILTLEEILEHKELL